MIPPSRYLIAGAMFGVVVGTLFALAVILLSDCGGPNCTQERITGLVGFALAGAVGGALLGAIVLLLHRLIDRLIAGRRDR